MLLNQYGLPFPPVEERVEARADNWQNHMTGIGTGSDKSAHGRFFPTFRVLDQELTNLHNGSDLAAHVVDRRPKEMFRRGYDIEADGITARQTEDIRDYATEVLDLDTNMREGFRWGRQYGGCLLLLNIDDGGYPWEPLNEDRIQSFNSVALVDRRYAYVQSQYASLNGAKYGRPEIYLISNAVACSGWNVHGSVKKKSGREIAKEGGQVSLVHESRVIRFDGNDTDVVTRQALAGWSWSVLQRVYDAMRQFEHAFDSVGYLLSDASQGVFKLQGLIKAITSGQRQAFADRLLLMEMTRSSMRGLALDAGGPKGEGAEDFTRVPTPFGSIPELLQMMMLRLAAAFEEPATILFGRAPGGLNADGDNEIRSWYDTIASEQTNEASPRLKRVYRLVGLAKRGPIKGGKDLRFKINHKPLWSPTDSETAKTTLAKAQRDKIYIDDGVVTPEEVAVDLGDIYPNLDIAARERVIKAKESFDPYPNDPDPVPPTPTGPSGPTSSALVNGAGGEPLGGPQVPVPIIGAGATNGGTPPKSPAAAGAKKAPPGKKPEPKADGNAIAVDVWTQLKEDFPEDAIGWVLKYPWAGPKEVPLDQIDYSNAAQWQASKEPVEVAFHTIRISEGVKKPVILVRVEGERLFHIADGHHRSLGYKAVGCPAMAYVVTVPKSEQCWQPMHDAQDEEGSPGSQQKGDRLDVTTPEGLLAYARRFDQRYPRLVVDFDPDQPRAANGEFGEGSSGAAPKSLAEHARGAVTKASAILKAAPEALAHRAVEAVKKQVHEAKEAFAGVRAVLNGGTMTSSQKDATKRVAVKIAATLASSAIASALPVLVHGLIAEKVTEHIAKHVAKHAAQKVLGHLLGLKLDAADPDGQFGEALARAVADELDALTDEELAELASGRDDAHDPRQPRDQGRLSSHVASRMGSDAYELGDAAGDSEAHHEAATAHAHAALEFRQLAARHARLGNTGASKRHLASAAEHDAAATAHLTRAGESAGRGDGPDDQPRDELGRFGSGGAAKAASDLTTHLFKHEGYTYRPDASPPKDGYRVSLPLSAGLNRVLDAKELALKSGSRAEARAAVKTAVREHLAKVLPYVKDKPDHFAGGYLEKTNEGQVVALHLDVSERHTDREKAYALGVERNQESIWDVAAGVPIKTGGTGR